MTTEEKKKVIRKGVSDEIILDKTKPYTHYYFYIEELEKTVLLEVGYHIKVVEKTDEYGGNPYMDWEYAYECLGCGELFTEDENIFEEEDGRMYCEDCGKDLISCCVCGKNYHPNEYEEDWEKVSCGITTNLMCDQCHKDLDHLT